jgi:hypothetical protein
MCCASRGSAPIAVQTPPAFGSKGVLYKTLSFLDQLLGVAPKLCVPKR